MLQEATERGDLIVDFNAGVTSTPTARTLRDMHQKFAAFHLYSAVLGAGKTEVVIRFFSQVLNPISYLTGKK